MYFLLWTGVRYVLFSYSFFWPARICYFVILSFPQKRISLFHLKNFLFLLLPGEFLWSVSDFVISLFTLVTANSTYMSPRFCRVPPGLPPLCESAGRLSRTPNRHSCSQAHLQLHSATWMPCNVQGDHLSGRPLSLCNTSQHIGHRHLNKSIIVRTSKIRYCLA